MSRAQALTLGIPSTALEKSQPLYYAASFGDIFLIRKLLETDPELDVDAPGGRFLSSPLQIAGYRGHTAAARLLLENKADPMGVDIQNESCLLWSILRGYHDVDKLLTKSRAYLTAQDLEVAERYGYLA